MLRLRFWLFAMDVCEFMRLPQGCYLWCLCRASDATDWGIGAKLGDEEPF